MKRFLLPIVASIGLGAGCAGSETGVAYSTGGYASEPDLYYVSPGVSVVAYSEYPTFYADNYYWRYTNNGWYRSPVYGGGWVSAYNVPYGVRAIPRPYAYRNWYPRAGYARTYPSAYSRNYYNRYYGRGAYNRGYYNRGYENRYRGGYPTYNRNNDNRYRGYQGYNRNYNRNYNRSYQGRSYNRPTSTQSYNRNYQGRSYNRPTSTQSHNRSTSYNRSTSSARSSPTTTRSSRSMGGMSRSTGGSRSAGRTSRSGSSGDHR